MKRRTRAQALRNQSQAEAPSQSSEGNNEDNDTFKECVNRCVRFIILRAGSNLPIRGPDIQKNVLSKTFRLDKVMNSAIQILKEVYGYNVQLSDHTVSVKQYVVSSTVPPIKLPENFEDRPSNKSDKILELLVLSHIYMSDNSSSSASLSEFLKALNINMEENNRSFGNVDEHINNTMVKQHLLDVEKDVTGERCTYKWGSKAEATISKLEVLNFVAKIYDKPITNWPSKLEEAQRQNLE